MDGVFQDTDPEALYAFPRSKIKLDQSESLIKVAEFPGKLSGFEREDNCYEIFRRV